jgi:hypothetical protein
MHAMPKGQYIDMQEQFAANQRSKEKLINEQHTKGHCNMIRIMNSIEFNKQVITVPTHASERT